MKNLLQKSSQAIFTMFAALSLVFTITSCETETDEEGRPYYTQFVDINITRCERVGHVLMMEFDVTNKKNNPLDVELDSPSFIDDDGQKYGSETLSMTGKDYYHLVEFPITSKGTVHGYVRINDFDLSERASSVNMSLRVRIQGEELADKAYENSKVKFVDNRVIDHGVQTNNTLLNWKVTSCQRDGDYVYLHFSVTNNTGIGLQKFGMGYGLEAECYDNLGGRYYDRAICFDDDRWYHLADTDRFAAGATINGTIRVRDVRESATELTVYIGVRAENGVEEDPVLRFLDIPIAN